MDMATQTEALIKSTSITHSADFMNDKRRELQEKEDEALQTWNTMKESALLDASHGFHCWRWNQINPKDETPVSTVRCMLGPQTGGLQQPQECKLEHRCMATMPHGGACLARNHTYVQHILFFDMPIEEAALLVKYDIITKEQYKLVTSLDKERKDKIHRMETSDIISTIKRYGRIDDYKLPVIENTDIINFDYFICKS